jgi:hypothetical protein
MSIIPPQTTAIIATITTVIPPSINALASSLSGSLGNYPGLWARNRSTIPHFER